MYITLKLIKRNLGFKGNSRHYYRNTYNFFIVLFCFTSLKISRVVGLMIGIFCLLPINFSKKNRMYKVIRLIFKYLTRNKIYVYQKERQVSEIE